MGVDHGGLEFLMADQFLNRPNLRAITRELGSGLAIVHLFQTVFLCQNLYGLNFQELNVWLQRAVAQTAFLKNLEPKTLALDVFNTDETCWHDSVDLIGQQAFHPV